MLNESPDDVMDVYVPGRWRCPKCEFQLSSATLFMGSGEIGCTRDQVMNMTDECCPNDGTPMGRVTWREEADANRKWGTDLMEEIIGATYAASLPEALESARRYRKALESIAASACCDRCNEAKLVASAALGPAQPVNAGATPSDQGVTESAQDSSSELARLRSLLQTTEAARDEAQRAAAEWREKLAAAKTRIVVDRDADLLIELRVWLDFQTITSENIGDIRRSLFVPWDSIWNGWVRGETSDRENRKR